jgi:hypothetical protein
MNLLGGQKGCFLQTRIRCCNNSIALDPFPFSYAAPATEAEEEASSSSQRLNLESLVCTIGTHRKVIGLNRSVNSLVNR